MLAKVDIFDTKLSLDARKKEFNEFLSHCSHLRRLLEPLAKAVLAFQKPGRNKTDVVMFFVNVYAAYDKLAKKSEKHLTKDKPKESRRYHFHKN